MDTDILIVGGGFSATMVAYHLSLQQPTPRVLQIAPDNHSYGVAYATQNPSHLLNVRTNRMGALPDDEAHFFGWLSSDEGKIAIRKTAPAYTPEPNNFAPRALYGAYVTHFATQANIPRILGIATTATIDGNRIRITLQTKQGEQSVSCQKLVVATGLGELPSPFAPLAVSGYDFLKYTPDQLRNDLKDQSHLLIIGTGLTAVDTLLSLEDAGFSGRISIASKHAWFPARHPDAPSPPLPPTETILAQRTALGLLVAIREATHRAVLEGKDWQQVIAGLRPHTQALWQQLPTTPQQIVFKKLFTLWNIHRHQMAPEIAARLKRMRQRNYFSLLRTGVKSLASTDGTIQASMHSGKIIQVSSVLDCTGPSYRRWLSEDPLLASLRERSLITAHANGVGIRTDTTLRASPLERPPVYVIGSLITGQWLESTAVPELRAQAASVASALNSSASC